MEELKNFKSNLESNLLTLNNFEGLESDLIQKHGDLRAQFSEYRDAIENSSVKDQEKRDHFGYHDELIKKLHKMILEAKALTRKRTEKMTRDELFKISQERQKALKPQSAEDRVGEDVTRSLKRMLETMRSEVERSSANIYTSSLTTKQLEGTTENYQKLSDTLDESRGLIRELWRKNRSDMIYIMGALGIFVATVIWVILQRTPGFVWLPGKIVARQFANLIPNTEKLVEKIAQVTESILSDDDESIANVFFDSLSREKKKGSGEQEIYDSDDLLKEENENSLDLKKAESEMIVEIQEGAVIEGNSSGTTNEPGIKIVEEANIETSLEAGSLKAAKIASETLEEKKVESLKSDSQTQSQSAKKDGKEEENLDSKNGPVIFREFSDVSGVTNTSILTTKSLKSINSTDSNQFSTAKETLISFNPPSQTEIEAFVPLSPTQTSESEPDFSSDIEKNYSWSDEHLEL